MPSPFPANQYSLLRIPASTAKTVAIRIASVADRDQFNPSGWPLTPLAPTAGMVGWWEIDVEGLGLADATYEYDFVLDGNTSNAIPDPFADEITRFDYYRGLFHITGGKRTKTPFRWDNAAEAGHTFPPNNKIVIYEMPLKWMSSATDNPLVDLGTFDDVIFERLDGLAALGINCIELLPIEDTSQTLDWGYGTRFYFVPDIDMGTPLDARYFIKCCHAKGIRVILDIVMAFASQDCPLANLASDVFFVPDGTDGRDSFGGDLFRYNTPVADGSFPAREFLCQMGEFWVQEYHVDGYRIDYFTGIANWDFVRQFHDRATAASVAAFPGKPFLVIAENTNREFQTTAAGPGGGKVVDAIWNFGFQQEVRTLTTGSMTTNPGDASRTDRVTHFLSKDGVWSGGNSFAPGYADLACAVNYATSHDTSDAPRMMNVFLSSALPALGLGDGSIANVKATMDGQLNACAVQAVAAALGRAFGVLALIMTSVGIPMLLAGDEFGDVHDTDFASADFHRKQQDPVQWQRAKLPGNAVLQGRSGELVKLRTAHPALQRNEVQFFYFHPTFDQVNPTAVFAYCRTAGAALGSAGQVIVVANMCGTAFASFDVPGWAWGATAMIEAGAAGGAAAFNAGTGAFSLSLDAFGVRVFSC